MFVKILGVIDIISGVICLILAAGQSIPGDFLVFMAALLIAKGFMGRLQEAGGYIDFFAAGILLLGVMFDLPGLLFLIISFLLFQKGVMSFL